MLCEPSLAALALLERLCVRITTLALESIGVAAQTFLFEHTDTHRIDSFSNSPFDFFYYNNSPAFAEFENCSRHIDPGLLTVVPVSPSPGLALLHPRTGEWIRVEECADLQPLRHVVAFTGHTLQELSSRADSVALPGVVHCVYKGARPRHSMVYELRTVTQMHQRPPSSFAMPRGNASGPELL